MLVVWVVLSIGEEITECGVYRDRGVAISRARLLGREFSAIEVAVKGAEPDQPSVYSALEYDALLDVHTWAGLYATETDAREAVGPRGMVAATGRATRRAEVTGSRNTAVGRDDRAARVPWARAEVRGPGGLARERAEDQRRCREVEAGLTLQA